MNRITFNPKILGGKPIIKGTRISVNFILELLASGMREEEILQEYLRLTKADVRAALEYAARNHRSLKSKLVILREDGFRMASL